MDVRKGEARGVEVEVEMVPGGGGHTVSKAAGIHDEVHTDARPHSAAREESSNPRPGGGERQPPQVEDQ